MEVVFFVEKKSYARVKDALLKDDIVSRASVVFKEASSLGFDKDGYYCYVSGTEEACNKARELVKDLVTIPRESKEVIEKIKSEEESAIEGFGGIFG